MGSSGSPATTKAVSSPVSKGRAVPYNLTPSLSRKCNAIFPFTSLLLLLFDYNIIVTQVAHSILSSISFHPLSVITVCSNLIFSFGGHSGIFCVIKSCSTLPVKVRFVATFLLLENTVNIQSLGHESNQVYSY